MTYRQLISILELHTESLDDDVTIHVGANNEFYPITGVNVTGEDADVLDPNSLYLEIDG